MRMSDWSSDVCSSDLYPFIVVLNTSANLVLMSIRLRVADDGEDAHSADELKKLLFASHRHGELGDVSVQALSHTLELPELSAGDLMRPARSEEHTSELQSLMRTSYAVFCLKKQT